MEFRSAVVGSVVALPGVVDRVVRRGERVVFERAFDSRERHLGDARVVAIVVAEQATRVEEPARLPELDHVGVVRIRIEVFLVVRPSQLAAEGGLGVAHCVDEGVGLVRHCPAPPA
ncbi:MAG: hypothetical protein V5A27_05045 [Halapricum sp.]